MTLKNDEGLLVLTEMLTYKRPHNSITENNFIKKFIDVLGPEVDGVGNRFMKIGKSEVMWSCHTDTVHKSGGKQKLEIKGGYIPLPWKAPSNCLGADNTTGVWLLTQMIKAGVPGLYIFHRGEEKGGIGSSYISDQTPELVEGIKYAIAFDRRGFNSVITRQFSGYTASDIFAKSVADALNMANLVPDDTGVFTDTANYIYLIPECTNVSVGFFGEHGLAERQHIGHALKLRDALIRFDEKKLIVGKGVEIYKPAPPVKTHKVSDLEKLFGGEISMVDVVKIYPEKVAYLLEKANLTPDDIINMK